MENEVIETEDEEIILINDIEITNQNDPEAVSIVKKEPKCNTTSVGDKVVAEGKHILKSNPKAKESGQRSWFDLK